ncbi:Vacuolar amino acid transporter 2 [Diplonema papillatum]|nr:Vacuolar amino acid transporter 2 [Diplonema papillatum]
MTVKMVPEVKEAPKPAGTASALFNMVNAILGPGVVSLSYAWAQSGFMLAWFLYIMVAIFACYTLELLVTVADQLCRDGEINVVAYDELVERVVGPKGRWLVLGSQFLFAYGTAVGYIVVIRDELPPALTQLTGADVFGDHELLVSLVLALCVLLPLSLLKSVAALSKASYICFTSSVVIICLMAYERATQRDVLCAGPSGLDVCVYTWTSVAKPSFLAVYGIFIFTKTCHHAEFTIYRSLGPNATPTRWRRVVRTAVFLCSLVTATCAMIVYSLFGDDVDSDFFKSFWKSSSVVSVGRVMFTLVIVMAFPLNMLVSRECLQVFILDYVQPALQKRNEETLENAVERKPICKNTNMDIQTYSTSTRESIVRIVLAPVEDEKLPDEAESPGVVRKADPRQSFEGVRASLARTMRASSALDRRDSNLVAPAAGGAIREDTPAALHYGTTLFLFATVVGIGSAVNSLGVVLNLVGGVAGSCICYILPGLVGYYSEEITSVPAPGGKLLAGLTGILGLVTIVISIVGTFYSG